GRPVAELLREPEPRMGVVVAGHSLDELDDVAAALAVAEAVPQPDPVLAVDLELVGVGAGAVLVLRQGTDAGELALAHRPEPVEQAEHAEHFRQGNLLLDLLEGDEGSVG